MSLGQSGSPGRPPGSPGADQPWAVSTAVLSGQPCVGPAHGPQEMVHIRASLSSSVLLPEFKSKHFLFFSRVAKEICAPFYPLLIEIKWVCLGRVACALIIMHNNDPHDTSSFHPDGCQGCSLTCSSSEERRGPRYPEPPVRWVMTGTGVSRAGGKHSPRTVRTGSSWKQPLLGDC